MPEDILIKLGAYIKKSRESCNLTQQRLSDLTGIAVRTISKIESGKMNPSFEILYIMIPYLGMSFDSLFLLSASQTDPRLQEIEVMYHNCSEQGKQLILASARAIAHELSARTDLTL